MIGWVQVLYRHLPRKSALYVRNEDKSTVDESV